MSSHGLPYLRHCAYLLFGTIFQADAPAQSAATDAPRGSRALRAGALPAASLHRTAEGIVHVEGELLVLWRVGTSPAAREVAIYELLRIGAEDRVGPLALDPVGRDNRYGWGRIDAGRSVRALREAVSYCSGSANSTGLEGRIASGGSLVVSNNDFRLSGRNLPPGAFAFFLLGSTRAHLPGAGGTTGTLCVGGQVGRIGASLQAVSPGGTIAHTLDLMQLPIPGAPTVQPGDRWCFQAWHRDSVPGFPTSNTTNALEARFR